jgi:hypothetical protein
VETIYLTLENTSSFKGVITDYTFTLQSTNTLPANGYIYIMLPIAWGNIILDNSKRPDDLKQLWDYISPSYNFIYDTSIFPGFKTLVIQTLFEWPGKQSIQL